MRDELTRLGVPATGVSAYSSSLNSTLPQSQFKSKVISLLSGGTPVIVNVDLVVHMDLEEQEMVTFLLF